MKFVHLTHADLIGKIKQHGLRPGHGRRGRGVYCVPLMAIARQHHSLDARAEPRVVDNVSTSLMWKWLLRDRHSTGRVMAVVFEAPASAWPLDVYLDLLPPTGLDVLDAVAVMEPSELICAPDDRRAALDALRHGYGSDCAFQARTTRGLGRLLHHYQTAVATQGVFGDSLEVVIRTPIAPAHIVRLVPRYQTNRAFHQKRNRLTRSDHTAYPPQ